MFRISDLEIRNFYLMSLHQPVLLLEAIDALNIQPNHWYIDGTFGRGGHTQAILKKEGNVIAFDADREAIEYGNQQFAKQIQSEQLILIHANFRELEKELSTRRPEIISGILFDFGTTVDQLKSESRGFSFESDSELDMRMDDRLGVKAKDLLALIDERQLANLFIEFGGEESAKAIAREIVYQRQKKPITSTKQLITIIERIKKGRRSHLHPATKVFQALRMAVNSELENIEDVLPQALETVKPGGRVVTISFHEGEDRIAKQFMKNWEEQGRGKQLTKKPIEPSEAELQINPRARSAKLRIFVKN